MTVLEMTRKIAIVVLLALALGIYAGNAGHPALIDDADGGHAVAAKEMLESGDWAVMRINGVRWLEKAPLHYWMVAAGYAVFGEGEFATRLPLALAVAGLALMVFAFGNEFFGGQAGFYAGLIITTGIGTFIFTRAMIPEAIYALEFTVAFYLFLRAWTGSLSARAGYWGCAAVMGLAVLTRGLIGFIFPAAVLGLFLLATGGLRSWREIPWLSSAAIFLAIAAPWHILVGLKTPGFFWFYFINEHFLRAMGARYPQDYGSVPLLYWWAAHLAWFFPWSAFLPYVLRELPAAQGWRQLDRGGQARLLVFLWAGFILLFFTISKRMEYYSFGAWPAIALLLGAGLARAEETRDRWLPRIQAGLAVAGALIAAVLGGYLWASRSVQTGPDISSLLELNKEDFYRVAMASFFDLTPQAFAALRVPAGMAAAAFLVGLAAAWWLRRKESHRGANLAMAGGMAVFLFAANLAFGVFSPHMSSKKLAETLNEHLKAEDRLAIYGEYYGACTVGFYTGRKVWIYNGRYHGLEFGSYFADAPKMFLTDQEFPAIWSGTQRMFLVAPQHHRRAVLLRLPGETTWLLAESGGKAVYVNRPLTPGQPSLARMAAADGERR